MGKHEAVFTKDFNSKKLTVSRAFDAPVTKVWNAWTKSEILDLWWAPRPYKANTKSMDFSEGGHWMYYMQGPQGDSTLCRVEYNTIKVEQSITSTVMFCNEDGSENTAFPRMYWTNIFVQTGDATTVNTEITYDKSADMEAIINMGFEAGYAAGLNNLDEYLAG